MVLSCGSAAFIHSSRCCQAASNERMVRWPLPFGLTMRNGPTVTVSMLDALRSRISLRSAESRRAAAASAAAWAGTMLSSSARSSALRSAEASWACSGATPARSSMHKTRLRQRVTASHIDQHPVAGEDVERARPLREDRVKQVEGGYESAHAEVLSQELDHNRPANENCRQNAEQPHRRLNRGGANRKKQRVGDQRG